MKTLDYLDPNDGRMYRVMLPDGAPDTHASMGIRLGPPDLSGLGLPDALADRLHRELWVRGLITAGDVARRPDELRHSLQAALKVDALRIAELYG